MRLTPVASGPAESPDELLTRAVALAAAQLRRAGPAPPRPETPLRDALASAVRALGETDVDHGKARISGGWHPLPGGLDLYAGIPPRLRWAAELKVEAICQQVWDTIKLSAGLHAGDFPHAYLVAAATHVAFEYSDGRELYAQTHPRRLSFCDLIADSALQWIEDLTYSGRPQRTPDAVAVARLTALPAWYGYELRLVRIDVPPDANELCFDGG